MCEKVQNFGNRSSRKSRLRFPPDTQNITSSDPKRSTLTILLVEDEEALRHIIIDLLTQLGYQVLGAANGTEALVMAERHPTTIDVLITDVLMPELAGPDLAVALRHSRPDLRIIFVSGDTPSNQNLIPGAVVLQKPFTLKMLSNKLSEVLQA